MKNFRYILFILIAFNLACSSSKTGKKPRVPKREVPIAINIKVENSASANFINSNYFRLQVIQDLDQFQEVNFLLVENDDNPEVVLNMNISSFSLWPKDERMSRRTVRRNIQVGTDNAGKPIYQTISATVDIVEVQRRSNARFETSINIKGTPPFKFQRTFAPNYNYVNTYIDNVQGDSRALDPSLMVRGVGIELTEDDFILILARQEMIRRLSSELRRYYDAQSKPAAE